jgi:hypothetical protein
MEEVCCCSGEVRKLAEKDSEVFRRIEAIYRNPSAIHHEKVESIKDKPKESLSQ